MIIVRVKGGMGNQMFQYAYARYLSVKYAEQIYLDLSVLNTYNDGYIRRWLDLDIFNVDYQLADPHHVQQFLRPETSRLNRLINRAKKYLPGSGYIYQSRAHDFNPALLQVGGHVYLNGYWQSYKYFEGIEPDIRSNFSLKKNHLPLCVAQMMMQMDLASSVPVCINVRRKDFVDSKFHLCLGMDHILKGMAVIEEQVDYPWYYIFSDDIAWCQKHLRHIKNSTIVGHGLAGPKFEYYHALMRCCKHFIIPNSSFAWWAAWLANHPEKIVVAPIQWYHNYEFDINNLCPPEWVLI